MSIAYYIKPIGKANNSSFQQVGDSLMDDISVTMDSSSEFMGGNIGGDVIPHLSLTSREQAISQAFIQAQHGNIQTVKPITSRVIL